MANLHVPPSGGSLEIGNSRKIGALRTAKLVPPSGGSLEIGNYILRTTRFRFGPNGSPFGGIPRNWKHVYRQNLKLGMALEVPPSGGSLEIGNSSEAPITIAGTFKMFPLRGDP